MMSDIIFLTELYYPEDTSTGYIMTQLAEGLALTSGDHTKVQVVCCQPTYALRGKVFPKVEQRNGVLIKRTSSISANKNKILSRLLSFFSVTLSLGIKAFRSSKSGDILVYVTNPPSLSLISLFLKKTKGIKPVLIVHDVYPEAAAAAGLLSENSLVYKAISFIQRILFNHNAKIVVLGRDMYNLIKTKGFPEGNISIIENWGQIDIIKVERKVRNPIRTKLNLEHKFIVQLSGNLGRTHGVQDLLDVACELRGNSEIHFLVIGWGAAKTYMEDFITREKLTNISILPRFPRDQSGDYMTCSDLFFLPFKDNMEGVSVPSRMYNVMASATPILAVCSSTAELARVVLEEQIGWVVQPGDVSRIVEIIQGAANNPDDIRRMGVCARKVVSSKYTEDIAVKKLIKVLEGV